MAFINCPHCEKEILDTAKKCSHCGQPIPAPTIRYNKNGHSIDPSPSFDQFVAQHHLETDQRLVLLTKGNAAIVESLIEEDEDCFPFSQMLFNYYGLEKIRTDEERALFAVAREIDRDNSTNVWRYKTNRNSFRHLISYIKNSENRFFQRLHEGDIKLPDDIVTHCGPGLKSLSSKICKFLCDFAYQQDHYYINDAYVRRMLLFYLDYYHVEHSNIRSSTTIDNMNYEDLYRWLEKLHKARDEKHADTITKNQLDHILWYCYKSFTL